MTDTFVDIVDFGARPTEKPGHNKRKIQEALDYASQNQLGWVRVTPALKAYECHGPIVVPERIRLFGHGYASDNNIDGFNSRLNFVSPAGEPPTEPCLRFHGNHSSIDGILIHASKHHGGKYPSIVEVKSTHFRAQNVYFGGEPEKAAVDLSASLYTSIEACTFSLEGDAAGVSALDDEGAYYGTNASWITDNVFNTWGPLFDGIGSVKIEGNVSERDNENGLPKIWLRSVATRPNHGYPTIINNYFEQLVDSAVKIQCAAFGRIDNNQIYSRGDGKTAIDVQHGYLDGSISKNHFQHWELGIYAQSSKSGGQQLLGNTSVQVQELVGGNFRPDQLIPGWVDQDALVVDLGRVTWRQGSGRSSSFASMRDSDDSRGKIFLRRSDHWLIHLEDSVLEVVDRAEFPGVRLTLYFERAARLRHNRDDYFVLAGRKDVTVPAGSIIEFIVVPRGEGNSVVEIGGFTASL